jgi:hypothetical protein
LEGGKTPPVDGEIEGDRYAGEISGKQVGGFSGKGAFLRGERESGGNLRH